MRGKIDDEILNQRTTKRKHVEEGKFQIQFFLDLQARVENVENMIFHKDVISTCWDEGKKCMKPEQDDNKTSKAKRVWRQRVERDENNMRKEAFCKTSTLIILMLFSFHWAILPRYLYPASPHRSALERRQERSLLATTTLFSLSRESDYLIDKNIKQEMNTHTHTQFVHIWYFLIYFITVQEKARAEL